ncbi:MAG: Bug family tripartite tricarboxylate transporter substrate binding protein [Lautropia sp.]
MIPMIRFVPACLLLALWLQPPASAQDFPVKPIRMIVPTAPGGLTDIPARIIAERMRSGLNQQSVIVENRAGAGGIIGAEAVKHAPADGYTLLYAQAPVLSYLPALAKKLPYDIFDDFDPVMLAVRAPLAIVVRGDSAYRSVSDLVQASRKRPGGLNYGTAGIGTASHLVGLMLAGEAGVPMTAVHNRGDAPALQDLLAGSVDFYMAGAVREQVAEGRLRALAVTGMDRWFVFPDAPTVKEAGYPGVEIYAYSGIMVPKKTPADVVARLSKAANDALSDSTVRERLQALGFDVRGGPPQDFARFLTGEVERYRQVGARNNLVLD